MTTDISSAAGSGSAEETAVLAVLKRILAAWEANDSAAFAESFVEDGTLILPGLFRAGREEIKKFMAAAYEGDLKGTRLTGTPVKVRFLTDTVCALITEGGVLGPGETEPAPERSIRATWLMHKQDGTWLLAGYQNSPRKRAAAHTPGR